MQAKKDNLQIAVVGGGSVGLLYAARLALYGQAVTVVTRRSPQSNQLMQNRLTLQELDGQKKIVSVNAQSIEHGLPHAHLYLLGVKQTELPDLLPMLQKLPADARVIALQNGLGHEEQLSNVLSERQCFFCHQYRRGKKAIGYRSLPYRKRSFADWSMGEKGNSRPAHKFVHCYSHFSWHERTARRIHQAICLEKAHGECADKSVNGLV